MLMVVEKEVTGEEWLNIQQALPYLCKRAQRPIPLDTFYHWIARGRVQHERVQKGKAIRFLFKSQWLDTIALEKLPIRQSTVQKAPRYGSPVPVHSDHDLEMLREQYGPLVDEEGLIQELERLTGHRYTEGAIKQRRLRGTLQVVGYSGKRRKQRWYPLGQLSYTRFYPENAKKQRSRYYGTQETV